MRTVRIEVWPYTICIALLVLSMSLFAGVIGYEMGDPNCETEWKNGMAEDDFCDTWWENDHVVIGPMWKAPAKVSG